MSSSLGFRNGGEHISPRAPRSTSRSTVVEIEQTTPDATYCSVFGCKLVCPVPQGFLVTFMLFSLAVTIPIADYYFDINYDSDYEKILVICASGLASFLLLIFGANMQTFYNVLLGLYIGVEIKVLDVTIDYAMDDDSTYYNATADEVVTFMKPDKDIVMSYVAAVAVLLHLIPLVTSTRGWLVVSMAVLGVPINTAICVFLDHTLLLQTFTTGISFLVIALCVIGTHGICASLLNEFACALKGSGFLVMRPLALKL